MAQATTSRPRPRPRPRLHSRFDLSALASALPPRRPVLRHSEARLQYQAAHPPTGIQRWVSQGVATPCPALENLNAFQVKCKLEMVRHAVSTDYCNGPISR